MPQTDQFAPSPFQAQPLPEQPAAPQPAVPVPSPLPPAPGFQFEGHGNISKGGAAAGMLDNIMRGYMTGKSMGEAKKALQLKKKSDDLNSSYTADAQRLWTVTQKQIAENGKIDPNSDEFKQAKSAVDGSWGALQDFRGQILDDSGGKKKGGKKQQDRTPAEVLSDPKSTPVEKAQALHGVSQKLGAPIYGQVQAYAAQAQARAQRPEVEDQELRSKAQLELDQLRSQKEPLTEAQQSRVKQLGEFLIPTPKVGTGKEGMTRYEQGRDGWEEYQVSPATGDEIPGTRRPLSTAGANIKPFRAWSKDSAGKFTSVLVDPKTNQQIPGTENPDIQPPAALAGRITSHEYFWTDNDGAVHHYDYSTTMRPTASAAGGGTTTGAAGTAPGGAVSAPHNATPKPPKVDSSAGHQTNSDGNVIGHKGPVSHAKVDALDKETQAEYKKATDAFHKQVDDLNDPALKLTAEQKDTAKKKYYDRLQEEYKTIGADHSQRMRDLGLIPAEDSSSSTKDSLGIL